MKPLDRAMIVMTVVGGIGTIIGILNWTVDKKLVALGSVALVSAVLPELMEFLYRSMDNDGNS